MDQKHEKQTILQIRGVTMYNPLGSMADDPGENWFKPNTSYHVAISPKTIEYLQPSSGEPYSVPVYFSGITSSETIWQYRTAALSYASVINPSKNYFPGDSTKYVVIEDDYYKEIFGEQDWADIKDMDDGSNGICFGLSYLVGAYKNRYGTISKLTSGYTQLAEVPIRSSNVLKYVEKAQIMQYLPLYQFEKKKNTGKRNEIFTAIKSGKDIMLAVGGEEGGHQIYPLGILKDESNAAVITVYDCNGEGHPYEYDRHSALGELILYKDMDGRIYSHHYRSFNIGISYFTITSLIDGLIGGTTPEIDSYLVTSSIALADYEFMCLMTPFNGDTAPGASNKYLYWCNNSSFHFDGADEPVTLTLSDGKSKLHVTLAAGQTATIDIENKEVSIGGVSNGGQPGDYEVRFSYAEEYDTFHDTVIKGTSGNSGTTLQKTDGQIEIQTDSGTNLTVSNEENEHSTGTTTVNLSQDHAVIRTDNGVANVFVDKDGDGNFTDREEPAATPATNPAGDNKPGKTDSKPASGTAPTGSKAQAASVVSGGTYAVGGQNYKVTAAAAGSTAGTVMFVKANNAKNVTVPATVKLEDGKTYQVTQIGAKAFTGKKIRKVTVGANVKKLASGAFSKSKATTVILKTKKLTKSGVKGSLKSSKVSKIQVKIGAKKVNKAYVKKYKKIFTKKNVGKKVSVK